MDFKASECRPMDTSTRAPVAPEILAAVRRADAGDAGELARLRCVMLASLDLDPGYDDHEWQLRARAWFAHRLSARRDRFAAFVVGDTPGAPLLATAVGWIDERLPGPTLPNGQRGYVAGVCTDPSVRGRGYGRAVVFSLLEWFRQAGVTQAELHATSGAQRLYRELGFQETGYPAMSVTLASAEHDRPAVMQFGSADRSRPDPRGR